MKKLQDLKKVLSYLELEGQGRGIIMEVTHPLLLGPFYLILRLGAQSVTLLSTLRDPMQLRQSQMRNQTKKSFLGGKKSSARV